MLHLMFYDDERSHWEYGIPAICSQLVQIIQLVLAVFVASVWRPFGLASVPVFATLLMVSQQLALILISVFFCMSLYRPEKLALVHDCFQLHITIQDINMQQNEAPSGQNDTRKRRRRRLRRTVFCFWTKTATIWASYSPYRASWAKRARAYAVWWLGIKW